MIITSTANPEIKERARLLTARGRREQQAFLVEGVRLLEEVLKADYPVTKVYYTAAGIGKERGQALFRQLKERAIPCQEVSEGVLAKLSATETPQGLVAVVPVRQQDFALPRPGRGIILVLDGIQDPGNLGTIIRTAFAAGIREVWTTPDSCDLYNPKTVRATMGAIFHLPCRDLTDSLAAVRAAAELGWWVTATALEGAVPYYRLDWRQPRLLLLGNEGRGLSPELLALARERVTIPMPGGAESLNVAVAAGILMYETIRQNSVV
ncbi:RNA methyltransferase [Carboxydocella sp. JDF658]|uniref:TrmH family RNA methyltransferase n=1 Tax=Carboxydocella sp. JDF658 TaxID=1926600 RepID=UPI0009AD3882|nr:RNA methyltransferase [Carboxydocella sp. JDF658]GAW32054.1 RNA methyltransferase, TrmH family [Carboxydocella sp. JDF658]